MRLCECDGRRVRPRNRLHPGNPTPQQDAVGPPGCASVRLRVAVLHWHCQSGNQHPPPPPNPTMPAGPRGAVGATHGGLRSGGRRPANGQAEGCEKGRFGRCATLQLQKSQQGSWKKGLCAPRVQMCSRRSPQSCAHHTPPLAAAAPNHPIAHLASSSIGGPSPARRRSDGYPRSRPY